ncbi:MAG: 50S ribosomal protein L23 [Acidobacteriota bacterium]|nr:50S ribosomal protein L23 [Acidobacteriota bacterium]MDQ7086614.1 50S ribosomal protein L23 [Acidobacteriota bacterium]
MSELSVWEVLRRPRLTEKATRLREEAQRWKKSGETYVFDVDPRANKIQVAQAVEQIFGVEVLHVRTANVRGKKRRYGRFEGYRASRKKAYVTLKPSSKTIDFLEG